MPGVQIAQRATDLDRAGAFHGRLLGVAPAARFAPRGCFDDTEGTTIALVEQRPRPA
jgi:methylmalonyl-CoA/ethylmalonyl-CoA epimerase